MTPLPMPEWGREGETWRVEPEDAVPWRTDVYGLMCRCELMTSRLRLAAYRTCREAAVAGYSTRAGDFHPFCEGHLREHRMWIEDGVVVSWRLSK